MKIRLFIDKDLCKEKTFFAQEKQVHYLFTVMKLNAQDKLFCFDNKSGEYLCRIEVISKKECKIAVLEKTKEFKQSPDVELWFAPVKKDNTDFIIQKATELGARAIVPVITKRTNAEKVRTERFVLQSIEAAEQSLRVDLPEIFEAVSLEKALSVFDKAKTLFFMDETLHGKSIKEVFNNKTFKGKSCVILVGPEGGFSGDELETLRLLPFAQAVTLGPRILRAETAVAAALSCWQMALGDF